MNKTIIININSIVFHIEEDAYETLRSYMIEIKKHFGRSADSTEILEDIENRIAEMFSEKIQAGRKEVISLQDVNEVIAQMGRVSDFENLDEENETTAHTENPIQDTAESLKGAYEKKLLRNPDDKVIGGVCSGLGYYFGMEAKWVRILFVLFFVFGGSSVLLYAVLWIVMPEASSRADRMAMKGEVPNLQNFKKNFEEELENYKSDFSKAKNYVSSGAKTVSGGVSSFFKIIGKIIGFALLFVCGMTIIGMFITWVGFISGILGYQTDMVFPGTAIFPTGQAIVALTAGVAAITIPFIALFQVLVRLFFKTKPMNPYISLTLWAGWIVSLITVMAFVFLGIREFKESSTVKVEKRLVPTEIYQFAEKDIRVIEASDAENGEKNIKIEVNGEELSSLMRREIGIRFESIDSLAKPYIQYSYNARGRTYKMASERASKINYLARQVDDKIIFDSHFTLDPSEKYRDQSVSTVVYLPVGAKVILEESLVYKLENVHYYNCSKDGAKKTEWLMTRNGLQCAPQFLLPQNEKEDNEVETTSKRMEEEALKLAEDAIKMTNEATKKIEETTKQL